MATKRNDPEFQDDGLIRRSFGVSVKGIDEDKRTVRVIASSEAIDSYDEIVDQSWDLERYEKNPVVLYNHNRGTAFAASPEASLPIGSASDVRVVDGKLEATLRFVDERANPLAEKIYQGFLQGSLRAVSVGFNSADIIEELHDGVSVFRLRNNELFEISVTPMGANPEAVAKNHKTQARAQLKALAARQSAQGQEKTHTMDLKEMQADLDNAKAKAAVLSKDLETEQARSAQLELDKKALETELDVSRKAATDATARAEKAEESLISTEIDGLIGKKILPAERDHFVALAKSNRELFAKMVESRPELSILNQNEVGAEPTAARSTDGDGHDNGEGLAGLVNSRMAG